MLYTIYSTTRKGGLDTPIAEVEAFSAGDALKQLAEVLDISNYDMGRRGDGLVISLHPHQRNGKWPERYYYTYTQNVSAAEAP